MNLTKTQWIVITVLGAVVIWYFFIRKKKMELSYDEDLLNLEENGYVRCADTTSIACCVAKYLDKNGHTADNYKKARKLCGGSSEEKQATESKFQTDGCGTLLDCCVAAAKITAPWKDAVTAKKDCEKQLAFGKKRGIIQRNKTNTSAGKTLPFSTISTSLLCYSPFSCCMKSAPVNSVADYINLEAHCAAQTI